MDLDRDMGEPVDPPKASLVRVRRLRTVRDNRGNHRVMARADSP
jgi:hypothetical protein